MLKVFALFSFLKLSSCVSISFTCRDELQRFISDKEVFTCTAGPQKFSVLTENTNVTEVITSDEATVPRVMEDSEVKFIKIFNHTILEFPNELGIYFSKAEGLQVTLCGLKTIQKESLRGFEKLKYLNLRQNSLEVLSHNLFEDNTKLEIILLGCNKLKIICANTLASLPNLREIDLRRNTCVSRKAQTDKELSLLYDDIVKKCPPSIEVYCTFDDLEFPSDILYGCEVRHWIIVHDYMTVSEFYGSHQGDKGNFHIKAIRTSDLRTRYLPIQLQRHFPRLEAIDITGGRLLRLEQRDIKAFPRLKILWLPRNEVSVLANDVFDKTLELEKISFYDNRLKFIGLETFKRLDRLWYVNFEHNNCINEEVFNDSEMAEVKLTIRKNCQ